MKIDLKSPNGILLTGIKLEAKYRLHAAAIMLKWPPPKIHFEPTILIFKQEFLGRTNHLLTFDTTGAA
jgi:hypothetical protein